MLRLTIRIATMLLLAALCLAVPHSARAGDPDAEKLAEAERLLRGPNESQVHQGARICLALDSVPAMELLLDVLNGEQPHFRDVVWEYLPRFKDAYARDRVAKELRTNRKNARVRQWCAQALGLFGDTGFAGTLEKALVTKEDFVQAATLNSLGLLKQAAAFEKVARYAKDSSEIVREAAVTAMARMDAERGWGPMYGALKDPDGGVRCAVLGRVTELYPQHVEEQSRLALEDEDWRPRMQAVDNLRALRTLTAVDALVRATGDERPVVANNAMAGLAAISGKRFTLLEQWQLWWTQSRATFKFPEPEEPDDGGKDDGDKGDGAKDGGKQDDKDDPPPDAGATDKPDAGGSVTVARYNGLPVVSDHVAFVVDKSASMRMSAESGVTKDARARAELDATLTALAGTHFVFNAYTYGAEQRRMSKKPVDLDVKSHKAVLEFVDGATPEGRKAIWEILETVVSDPLLDTVYLLSSGEPEVGLYVHWNRVTEHLAELNRFHKVTVHTVVWNERQWYRDQLRKIAECTGGSFVAEK